MYFLRNNLIQKTSTVFLITLFLFIHAVKIFHTHSFSHNAANNYNNKNATVVKANFFCAICDFQIAKDSDAEAATFNIATPEHAVAPHYYFTLLQLHNVSVTSSVRGPPVNLS